MDRAEVRSGNFRSPSELDCGASFPLARPGFGSWKRVPQMMSPTRAAWLFIIGLTLVRLSMLGTTDLEFDEAHYWMWSEHLAPAYFSKGPGVAFAIRAGTAILGPTETGVRLFSPIL